ncbi:NUDIX hydrolase [Streptomyces albidoflavus]|uniref:NUDIX hydrolase n=1 Tax=Streptomyces albidoflavus TaxID=1886 RepID=UPI00340C8F4E
MPVTPAPDTPPSTMMTNEEYGGLRAAAALWVGTSVLITDERGRILVQHVDYRTTCLLPGGGVDENEPPAQGARREVREELGVTTTVDRGARRGLGQRRQPQRARRHALPRRDPARLRRRDLGQ